MNISSLKNKVKILLICGVVLGLFLCVMTWKTSPAVAYICAGIILVLAALVIYGYTKFRKTAIAMLSDVAQKISPYKKEIFSQFPMPILVCDKNGEICWYSKKFGEDVLTQGDKPEKYSDIFGAEFDGNTISSDTVEIEYGSKHFKVIYESIDQYNVFYFLDITTDKNKRLEFDRTRPCVMIATIDNYYEMVQDLKESEKASIRSQIDTILEEFESSYNIFLRRVSTQRFLGVIQHDDLQRLIADKFGVLDKMRKIATSDNINVTMSIGVGGCCATLAQSELNAKQALDMCLGRGGDQVAIKTTNGFDFFGGVSRGVERTTKVKTRIIATAITELVAECQNVVIMGHKFSDLDCLGGAIGLAKAIRALGKQATIAVNRDKSLAQALIDRHIKLGEADLFSAPAEILEYVNKNTLLFILDTHNKDFIESPQVYNACKNVVVIDHHRKVINHIDNAVVFFHEPFASSASEMVTELVQYFGPECKITKNEAEALLAGITLDTKNFTLRTGVRTFEAAAYLRKCGADTTQVRMLFSSSIDSYQRKTRLVSSAEIYKGCAIATSGFQSDDLRVVAPQAADELLGISDVSASFVVYEIGDQVHISARSMGVINVQVVMEYLGGGGHHTMAATQLSSVSLDNAKQKLLEAIDNYYDEHTNA